jgi:hypothetical protein
MLAVDLDGLASSAEGDHAVLATAKMIFKVSPHPDAYFVVNEIVQLRQKL